MQITFLKIRSADGKLLEHKLLSITQRTSRSLIRILERASSLNIPLKGIITMLPAKKLRSTLHLRHRKDSLAVPAHAATASHTPATPTPISRQRTYCDEKSKKVIEIHYLGRKANISSSNDAVIDMRKKCFCSTGSPLLNR